MADYQMGVAEASFAEIIWRLAPAKASDVVKAGVDAFGWKKTTAYTVLSRLCAKGVFSNENGVVSVVVGREEYLSLKSADFVDRHFSGSLPGFIAAFAGAKKLSEKDVAELRALIDSIGEGG